MLTPEETKNIKIIYSNFLDGEDKGWGAIDDALEMIEWLNDEQVVIEAETIYEYQKDKKMGCPYKHAENKKCLVHDIIDAVKSILNLYKETKYLHEKNRYIISYYIALSNLGMIVEMP